MSSGYYLTSSFYYFNLGAHMIYILRNRLQAQNVRKQKIVRILQDICNAIFKQHFIQSLMLPQDPFNVNALKDVFSRLAHSSIMKLDQASMDKMFYLMLMSIKKQIFLTSSPLEIYSLTLCHLLNIAKYLEGSQAVGNIEFAVSQFQKFASKYTFIQYLQIREYMLSQLQKYQTKIVNFIQNNFQTSNGRMIFRLRNGHNQKSIGSSVNQADQDNKQKIATPQNQMFYNNWISWRSSLVIDFVQDYKRSSERRNNKINSSTSQPKSSKQQSLQDILNIKFDDIQNFEVKFDMFEDTNNSNKMENFEYQGSNNNKKKTGNISINQPNKSANTFKNKIQKEFADLKIDKTNQDEEIDLLQMMDN